MKNIVITGSTRGIGFCLAREFLKLGCRVTVSGRSERSFAGAKWEMADSECLERVLFVPCDVRIKKEQEKLWQESAVKWGRVDIWINNAGQNSPYEFSYDIEEKYVEAIIDTNIKGMIYGSQIAAKQMLAQGSGQIWNMEGLGSNDMIQAKTILYGTSKRTLTYFTKALAKELEGTSVLAGRLSPGMMLTDFITKTPDGENSPVVEDPRFKKIFNILGDKPETVAAFFAPRILNNTQNNAHIVWLSPAKSLLRFTRAAFKPRKLL